MTQFTLNKMLTANRIRSVLIMALAVVSYLLIYQWKEDNSADNVQPTSSMERRVENSTLLGQPVTTPTFVDAPVSSSPIGKTTNDLPSIPAAVNQSNSVPVGNNQPTQSAQLITVKTDVLNIAIDLKGGDIVYAALLKYPVSIEKSNQPFILLNQSPSLTYIAQSGVVSAAGKDLDAEQRPLFVSAQSHYELQGEQLNVVLNYQWANGMQAKKIFEFKKGNYLVGIKYEINNHTAQTWQGSFFTQLKRDSAPDPSAGNKSLFSLPTYMGAAYSKPTERFNKLDFSDIEEKGNKALDETIKGGWVAMVQHYFLSAWVPNKNENYHFYAKRIGEDNIIGAASPLVNVMPGTQADISAELYLGPKIQEQLKKVADGLDLSIDYGILFFISHLLYLLLNFIHSLVGNWGWSIVFLTLCVKLLFFYPSAISYRSMAKMRKAQPELLRIREKHSTDRQALSQAMMKLYRDEKINPLGGCLPVLLQMPVFMALYWVLLESVELRHAGFMLWIKDLSVMDPYLILPLLMGVSMFLQAQLNPTPPDPMQAKLMKWMPIMFTFFFLFFPAGLVLYWLTNNILSIAQQWYITKKIDAEK